MAGVQRRRRDIDRRVRRLVTTEKSMSAVEIVEWKPTPETRWYSPDRRYVPERLERRFECKASDGTSGHLWAEVYPESPFVRVTKTPNAGGKPLSETKSD